MLTALLLATIVSAHGKNLGDDNTDFVQTSALVPNPVREIVDAAVSSIKASSNWDDATCTLSNLALTKLQYSNLGGLGPDKKQKNGDLQKEEIRYSFVTTVDGSPVDLVIKNTSQYLPGYTNKSGFANSVKKNGGYTLANINVQGNTSVDISVSFVKSGTDTPVSFAKVFLSWYDFDHDTKDVKNDGTTSTEKISVLTAMAAGSATTGDYVTETTVDGFPTFQGTQSGTGGDNPTSSIDMNETQKKKSVALQFTNKPTMEFRLATWGMTNGRNMILQGSSALVCSADSLDVTKNPPKWPVKACPAGKGVTTTEPEPCGTSDLHLSSNVKCNNLGGQGPDYSCAEKSIRYAVATTYGGKPVDLVIEAESDYSAKTNIYNGRGDKPDYFAINVRCGTSVDLKFSFVMEDTMDPVTIDELWFSVLDFDHMKSGKGVEEAEFFGFEKFSKGGNVLQDGSQKFRSQVSGTGADNPISTKSLSGEQKDKMVSGKISGKSSFKIRVGVVGPSCNTGRNFLFGGSSSRDCPALETLETCE